MSEENIVKKKKEAPEELLNKVNAAAERLEKGNAELAKLLEKQESLKVEATLGGESDAGAQKKSAEDVKAESAKKFLEGTGLEDAAFPSEK